MKGLVDLESILFGERSLADLNVPQMAGMDSSELAELKQGEVECLSPMSDDVANHLLGVTGGRCLVTS